MIFLAHGAALVEIADGIFGKSCTTCGELKPLHDYHKSARGIGGRAAKCKQCKSLFMADNSEKYRRPYSEEKKEYMRNYRLTNAEHIKRSEKSYKEAHKAEISEYNKQYYRAHKDKILEYSAKRFKVYYKLNRSEFIARAQQRRAKEKALPHTATAETVDDIFDKFNYKCPISGSSNISVDHFIAINTGCVGHVKENLIPLDLTLNKSKKDRNPFKWAEELTDEQLLGFYETIAYLAEVNHMTTLEYQDFVNECYTKNSPNVHDYKLQRI